MTTAVKVDAHAGWPVRVKHIHPETKEEVQPEVIVPALHDRIFYVHSGLALVISEVQPDEVA